MHRHLSSHVFGLRSMVAVIAVVLVAATAWGCQSDELSEDDAKLVRDIFRSGLEMEPDPFVRAESLRALKLTGDDRLAQHAEPLTRDDHPMVRLAALRKLVASDHPEADNRAAHLFNRGDEDEQFHVLDIVVEEGNEELREDILDSAHHTDSFRLRRHALEKGLIQEIEAADDSELDDLLTELGQFVLDDDPDVAGIALRVVVDHGEEGRAERFLERVGDETQPIDVRVHAARVLARGRVEAARQHFEAILADAGADDPEDFGIPQEPVDEDLLRWSILGMAALGDPDFVAPAQRYLRNVDTDELLEVLDALSTNPSPDATVSLRSRLRDRPPVGRRALELYAPRSDARLTSLIEATTHSDHQTRRRAASLLLTHFSGPWLHHLEERLEYADSAEIISTLRKIQNLFEGDEQRQVVDAVDEQLHALATGQHGDVTDDEEHRDEMARTISTLAAYLLFSTTGDSTYADIIVSSPDRQTLYAFLEHAATHKPSEHIDILRPHLHDDVYVARLMAATGLWKAMGDSVDLHLIQWVASKE